MKRLIFGSIVIGILYSGSAYANTIDDMRIEAHINEDGSVNVTEFRNQTMDSGTENYIVFDDEDMGHVQISDFSVEGFEYEEDWDLDWSQEEKSGKYGMVDTDSGQELVFGIGEYGNQSYVVHYTLENMVRNLDDGQSLFWNFDTFTGLHTENFAMEITSDIPLTEADIQYWGFGFEGDIDLIDGTVYWDSTEALDTSNDVIVLMHFDEDTYQSNVQDSGTLAEEREGAMDGSIYENMTGEEEMPLLAKILFIILGIVGGVVAILGIILATLTTKLQKEHGHIESAGKIRNRNKGLERKVAPDVSDYADIYSLLHNLRFSSFDEIYQAYLMKWDDEGRISIELEKGEGWFSSDKTHITIHDYDDVARRYNYTIEDVAKAVKREGLTISYEAVIWRMFVEMADSSGYMDERQIKKWTKKNAKHVEKIVDYLSIYSLEKLESEGYLNLIQEKAWFVNAKIIQMTDKGNKLLDDLSQYKNYLKDNLDEVFDNPHNEQELKSHIIWLVLLGEDSNVKKHLEKLIPSEKDTLSNFYPYYLFYHTSSTTKRTTTEGLTSGGFSSSNSSAASGSGGGTGVGGGGGAGGGGGGGAR